MSKYILGIETATQVCSVALTLGNDVIASMSLNEKNIHASSLNPLIEELLKQTQLEFKQLDAVAVSKGPGSYTGLRIGVSAAKGFCYGLDIPLVAVNTLQSMALGMTELVNESYDKPLLFCPMIDARRMEVYDALYNENNKEIRATQADVIDYNSFSEYTDKYQTIIAGDGAEKCKSVLGNNTSFSFIDDFIPSAEDLLQIALQKFANQQFEDVAYFEPFYLKDFIAGKPKVKGLD